MSADASLPSYERLFGDLDLAGIDSARSVYSPAAYLAHLLQLLQDHVDDPALLRRPRLDEVALDAENTCTEPPYPDIVNDVLADAVDPVDEALRKKRSRAGLPFTLRHERLLTVLRQLSPSRSTVSGEPRTGWGLC